MDNAIGALRDLKSEAEERLEETKERIEKQRQLLDDLQLWEAEYKQKIQDYISAIIALERIVNA